MSSPDTSDSLKFLIAVQPCLTHSKYQLNSRTPFPQRTVDNLSMMGACGFLGLRCADSLALVSYLLP